MFRPVLVTAFLALASAVGAREGDLDTSFNDSGMQVLKYDESVSRYDAAARVLVDKQGRYALVGYVDPGQVTVAYLRPDGKYLYAIATSYSGLFEVTDAAIDTQGRIVVVGNSRILTGGVYDTNPVVCRFNTSGYPDTSLGAQGCRTYAINKVANGYDAARAVAMDALDNIYIAGTAQFAAEDYDFLVMKLDSFANPVPGFGTGGTRLVAFDIDGGHAGGDSDDGYALLLQPPYLYVGGMAADELGFDFALAKLSTLDGSYDPNFCPTGNPCSGSEIVSAGKRTTSYNFGGTNADKIQALAAASDGTIIVGGTAAGSSGSHQYVVTKLTTTGHFPLAAFGDNVNHYASDAIQADTQLNSLVVRDDDSILIAGTTTPLSSPSRYLWVRQLTYSGGLVHDFATTELNQPVDTALIKLPNWNNSLPIDHVCGAITLDRGRILLAGARLWWRDTPSGVNDFDYAVVRLQGDAIFVDGLDF